MLSSLFYISYEIISENTLYKLVLVKAKLKTPPRFILVNVLYNNDKRFITIFRLVKHPCNVDKEVFGCNQAQVMLKARDMITNNSQHVFPILAI